MLCRFSVADPGWKNPDTGSGMENPDQGTGIEKSRSGTLITTLYFTVLGNSSQQPVFFIRYGTEPYDTVLIHNWFLALPFKIEGHNWHTAHVRAAVLGPGCFEEKRPYLTTIHPSLHNCSHVLVQHRYIGSWKEWLQIRTRDNCAPVFYFQNSLRLYCSLKWRNAGEHRLLCVKTFDTQKNLRFRIQMRIGKGFGIGSWHSGVDPRPQNTHSHLCNGI